MIKLNESLLDTILKIIGAICILFVLVYASNEYYKLGIELLEKQERLTNLEKEIVVLNAEKEVLKESLENEQRINGTYVEQIDEITDQVKDLEKIANTDKELLQKYSKVFFLNEHYIPSKIRDIPSTWLTANSKPFQIHSKVYPFLRNLIEDAKDANNPIQIASAYRSFETQASLKTAYKSVFGTGANAFSADQGYSEHQLGTTVDLTTPILQSTYVSFETTPAFKWLTEHAHEYGFTLSYPKNNKYYTYEPWHWRFVGVELATRLYEDGKYFYDLDQREIDKYLLNIFE